MNAAAHILRRHHRWLSCAQNVRIVCMVIQTASTNSWMDAVDCVIGMVQFLSTSVVCKVSLSNHITIRCIKPVNRVGSDINIARHSLANRVIHASFSSLLTVAENFAISLHLGQINERIDRQLGNVREIAIAPPYFNLRQNTEKVTVG